MKRKIGRKPDKNNRSDVVTCHSLNIRATRRETNQAHSIVLDPRSRSVSHAALCARRFVRVLFALGVRTCPQI